MKTVRIKPVTQYTAGDVRALGEKLEHDTCTKRPDDFPAGTLSVLDRASWEYLSDSLRDLADVMERTRPMLLSPNEWTLDRITTCGLADRVAAEVTYMQSDSDVMETVSLVVSCWGLAIVEEGR